MCSVRVWMKLYDPPTTFLRGSTPLKHHVLFQASSLLGSFPVLPRQSPSYYLHWRWSVAARRCYDRAYQCPPYIQRCLTFILHRRVGSIQFRFRGRLRSASLLIRSRCPGKSSIGALNVYMLPAGRPERIWTTCKIRTTSEIDTVGREITSPFLKCQQGLQNEVLQGFNMNSIRFVWGSDHVF